MTKQELFERICKDLDGRGLFDGVDDDMIEEIKEELQDNIDLFGKFYGCD